MNNKVVITHGGSTYEVDNSKLYGGVNYTQSVNDEEDFSVGTTASAKIEFVTDETHLAVGDKCTYSVQFKSDVSYRQIGVFNITSVEKQKNQYKVTAFDNVYLFENKIIDDYWNNLTFPKTIYQVFSGLCAYVDNTLTYDSSITNGTYSVPRQTIEAGNMSGRELLGYIASCTGGYACADSTGKICMKSYATNATVLDGSKYKSLELSDYTIPQIDRVWCGMSDTDVGVFYPTSGTPTNVLRITYDPLFFIESGESSTLLSAIQTIYNKVHPFTYKSGEITLYEDYEVSCGDILTISGSSFLVMEKNISKTGVVLRGFGNATRDVGNNYITNEITKATSGVYHDIEVEVDSLSSTVGTLSGDVTVLSQDVSSIGASVSGKLDATGGQTQATKCSWVLNSTSWSVYLGASQSDSTLQFRVNSSGAYVKGKIEADSGYLKNLNITGTLTLKESIPRMYIRGCGTNEDVSDGRDLIFVGGYESSSVPSFNVAGVYGTGYTTVTDFHLGWNDDVSTWRDNRLSLLVYGISYTYWGTSHSIMWDDVYNSVYSSDRNKKHDIYDLDNKYTDLFDMLHPVKFKYNDGTSDRYHTGLIAQEVVEAIEKSGLTTQDLATVVYSENDEWAKDHAEHRKDPDYVSPYDKKSWKLRYHELIPLCINEIQKLKARVAELEK